MTIAARVDDRRRLAGAGSRALLWAAAVIFVAAVHIGIVWIAIGWRSPPPLDGEPPPAVMIELASVAVAPKAPLQEVAPGPVSADAAPASTDAPIAGMQSDPQPAISQRPPLEERPTPLAPTAKPLAPARQAQEDTPPLPTPVPEIKLPTPPTEKQAEAVLPPPSAAQSERSPRAAPKPAPAAAAPKEKVAAPVTQPKSRREKSPKSNHDREARRASAPPRSRAQPAASIAAPTSSASVAPAVALATWKGALLALLNRNKRYPAAATGFGTASVAFAIDRAGHVLSVRLTASSGDRALDEEAVALLHRSDPVPAPPPEFGGRVITLNAPVRFERSP